MNISRFCKRDVVSISPESTALEAATMMKEYNVGDLVVVVCPERHRQPVGIVTDRDLTIKVMAECLDAERVKVRDVMTPDPALVLDSDSILQATEVMKGAGVRRLPVIHSSGSLMGVISMDDLYTVLSAELQNLAKVCWKQSASESRPGNSRDLIL